MDRGQEFRLKPLPGSVLGLAGALLTATLALLTVGYPRLADALPSKGSNCSGCHGTATPTSKPSKKKAATAAPAKTPAVESQPSPAAPAITEVEPGRALDYVPWTLSDPYYSHFLYRSDDYRK
jgi:hypothetical protein